MSCEKIILNYQVCPQVFIILQLKDRLSSKILTIVCLHLKSKEKYFQKRKEQIEKILDALKIHLNGSGLNLDQHPILIVGDFNGEPFEDFYKLIVNDNELKNLKDAYFQNEKKEPTTIKLRNNKEMIKRGIDYMFYNQNSLKLIGHLELPKDEKIIEEQGLPNLLYSSDHLSLISDFIIC